jgi:hypothetical protein
MSSLNRVGLIGYKVFFSFHSNDASFDNNKLLIQNHAVFLACVQFSAVDRLAAVFVVGFTLAGILSI